MPKVDLDAADLAQLGNALDLAAKSMHRAQNTGKTPQLRAIYQQEENIILALKARLAQIRTGP